MAASVLRRLYAPEFMVKESLKSGEIPSTSQGYRNAFGIAWASITEMFLVALIGMIDTVMVSSVGEAAVAAVGLTMQPRFLVQTLVMALNIAITSICARRKGEENAYGALCCLKQGLVLSLMFSVLLSALAFLLARPLVLFMGAMPDTANLAYDYFAIILLGLPLSNLSMTISSAQRGIGYTKSSMRINMIANIVNMIFNYLLIGGNLGFPALGVRGAAIATVIGWGVGFVVALVSICRRTGYFNILNKSGWKFEKSTIAAMYRVGSGSFLEQMCMRIGFISYSKIVAGLGTTMLAAHHMLINIMSLSFSFGEGFGIAASSLVGQNLGAKRPDLSIVYGKICQRMGLITAAVLFVVFKLFGRNILLMFNASEEILEIGSVILLLMGVIVFGQSSQMVFMGSLRGAGDTKYTAVVSLLSIMILRPILAYTFAYTFGWGLIGAWCSFFIDQYLRLILTYVRFSSGKWISIKL